MRRAIPLWTAALLLGSCDEGFDPRSELTAYRVLGVQADKAEATPADTVRLRVFEYAPPPEAGASAPKPYYIWALCPFSLEGYTQFSCAVPELEIFRATDEPELVIDLPATFGEWLRRIQSMPMPEGAGEAPALPDLKAGMTLYVRLFSGREGAGHAESVKRVYVRDPTDGPPLNRNPDAVRILIGGRDDVVAVPAGEEHTLRIEVDPSSIDLLPPEHAGDEPFREELLYSWFTTGGELDGSVGLDEDVEAALKFPRDPGPVVLFCAVRDGRGGFDIVRYPPYPAPGEPEPAPLMVTEPLE